MEVGKSIDRDQHNMTSFSLYVAAPGQKDQQSKKADELG
jgi:hypothetical protein